LRINPQLKIVADDRYDPCRNNSKLGIPLDEIAKISKNSSALFKGINGILIHTNCDSSDFLPLLKTVKHMQDGLKPILEQVEWINLGGGYLFNESTDLDNLHEVIDLIHRQYSVNILFEPGASIVRRAGYIISTVVDMFANGNKTVAVLDTSVNHMPEVFEYQFQPDITTESSDGNYSYLLAGATCLAGDLFGEYRFIEPLHIGSLVIFNNIGAYSQVKANMFNGINLPSIYALTESGKIILQKEFTYADFLALNGDGRHVYL
jgi:carboxynorspermidine decarboxylase